MFAYCLNNPVSMADDDGEAAHIVVGAVLGAAFGALDAYMSGENVIAGALLGGITGGIAAVIPTTIGASVAKKATSKVAKFIVKNAMPMAHAAFEAGSDYVSQVTQAKLKNESFSWDAKSTVNAAVVGFTGAKTANRVNKLTGNLLTSDKAAEAAYEYFSGLFYGTTNLIKSHRRSK